MDPFSTIGRSCEELAGRTAAVTGIETVPQSGLWRTTQPLVAFLAPTKVRVQDNPTPTNGPNGVCDERRPERGRDRCQPIHRRGGSRYREVVQRHGRRAVD